MNSDKFLRLARSISLESEHQHKLGVVISSGNRILSVGYNQIRHLKIGKKFTEYDCSLHAERDACSKVDKKKLKGTTLTIYREHKDGSPAEAFPCDQCLFLLTEMKIKKIVSSTAKFPFYKVTKL